MKLYAARHGETVYNANRIVQGHIDSELSARGVEQANDLAQSLKSEKLDLLFSSDLKRASDTADFVAEVLSKQPYHDWRLRERSFGELEGTSSEGLDWKEFWSRDENEQPNGAESVRAFRRRICLFLVELDSEFSGGEAVLLVAHGGVLNQLRYLQEPETYEGGYFENAKRYEFEYGAVVSNAKKVLRQI